MAPRSLLEAALEDRHHAGLGAARGDPVQQDAPLRLVPLGGRVEVADELVDRAFEVEFRAPAAPGRFRNGRDGYP
jgi:hypothetical protein